MSTETHQQQPATKAPEVPEQRSALDLVRFVAEQQPKRTAPACKDLSPLELKAALFAALARARARIEAVEKDGQSTGNQRYKFASAQAILECGRPALAAEGLSLFPLNHKFAEEDGMMLFTEYLLVHELGGEMIINSMTPVVITEFNSGSRTARDKALTAAKTVDLRLAYRNLLGIAQIDAEEEEHGRNDENGRETYRGRGGHSAQRNEDPRRQDPRPPPREQQQQQQKEPPKQPPQQPPPQQPNGNGNGAPPSDNEDIKKRRADLRAQIERDRIELGPELCAQLGLDGKPQKMDEAEALAKRLAEAVKKKRDKAPAPAPQQPPPPDQPKDEPAMDWS